ncbi:LytTR family DNA-binding domain-containing protein [uncultured Polaribacter sp.]|uniref:LytR/AlgR family response regulator transcription factor n=1 Tax=uncultured Polaribacter sp. TaxID=174711 RepID=UPI00262329D3|nr:response regulator transcription factor [uncultured Polaribacter sp.]
MLKPLKVFIVEDMAISRASLESILISNNYEISGSVAKAEIAWEELLENKTDLVLIDINLAGQKNGIWLGQKIRQHLKLPIIYLTAYGDQKTLKEVLETKPNGYLMKPYQEPTLLTTINIAITNFLAQKEEEKQPHLEDEIKSFLFIKDKFMRIKLELKDILFIKSEGNYLEISLENKTHVVRSKLSEFKKLLPTTVFLQTHQRYVINITKIKVIGKDFLTINNTDIPISSKYKKSIEKALSFL